MVTTAEFDVKQAILVNGPFGPAEVKQIREAISRDHANFQRLRDAVNELQTKEEQTPASMVRLGVALYLLGRYYRASEVLKQADGGAMAHFYLAKSLFARSQLPGSRRKLPVGGKGRLRRGPMRPGPGRGPALCRQSAGRPGGAGQPLRRGRTHGRLSLSARRHGGGRRRQPDRSGRPVRAGRRGRSQPSRRAVRIGPGERSLRQRRHGLGILQAGRVDVPDARRFAAESRPALRRSRPVREGRPVLPAGVGCLSRSRPGRPVLQGYRGLARAVLSTTTP